MQYFLLRKSIFGNLFSVLFLLSFLKMNLLRQKKKVVLLLCGYALVLCVVFMKTDVLHRMASKIHSVSKYRVFTRSTPPPSSHKTTNTTLEFKGRREMIRKYCHGHAPSYALPADLHKYFSFSPRQRVVYCGIQKVGTSFLYRLMKVLLGKVSEKNFFEGTFRHSVGIRGTYGFRNKTPEQVRPLLENYRKFMFVRDPYARLFSAYMDKIFLPTRRMFSAAHKASVLHVGPYEKSGERATTVDHSTQNTSGDDEGKWGKTLRRNLESDGKENSDIQFDSGKDERSTNVAHWTQNRDEGGEMGRGNLDSDGKGNSQIHFETEDKNSDKVYRIGSERSKGGVMQKGNLDSDGKVNSQTHFDSEKEGGKGRETQRGNLNSDGKVNSEIHVDSKGKNYSDKVYRVHAGSRALTSTTNLQLDGKENSQNQFDSEKEDKDSDKINWLQSADSNAFIIASNLVLDGKVNSETHFESEKEDKNSDEVYRPQAKKASDSNALRSAGNGNGDDGEHDNGDDDDDNERAHQFGIRRPLQDNGNIDDNDNDDDNDYNNDENDLMHQFRRRRLLEENGKNDDNDDDNDDDDNEDDYNNDETDRVDQFIRRRLLEENDKNDDNDDDYNNDEKDWMHQFRRRRLLEESGNDDDNGNDKNKARVHQSGRHRRRNRTQCMLNVTFETFLEIVVTGTWTDDHWHPMHKHCRPCDVDFDYVGKMESFQTDLEFILNQVGEENVSHILQHQPDKFQESSERMAVKDLVKGILHYVKRQCSQAEYFCKVMKRIWTTLLTRGLISKEVRYPFSEWNCQDISTREYSVVVNVLLAYSKHAGNRKERMRQRQEAMTEAYSRLPRNLLKRVEEYVRQDCEMFGYECSVDKRFPVSRMLNVRENLGSGHSDGSGGLEMFSYFDEFW